MTGDQDARSDAERVPSPGGRSRLRGSSRPRRLARRLAVALAVLLPAAAWGVATAQTQAGLGPHLARYEVTVDDLVTVDLGPLGTLVIDSPLPLTLGARVVVQEIPREVTAVDQSATLEALGADLQAYAQFFGSPQATVGTAVRGLVTDAVRRTGLAGLVLVTGIWLVRAGLGPRRRAELTAQLRPHRVLVGGVAVAVVVAGTVTSSGPLARPADAARQASTVFDGTPLEGARLTGRLAGVIDTYGGYVVDAYRENEDFYDAAVVDLEVAWTERSAAEEDAAARAAEQQQSPPASVPPDATVLLVVSDLHCNVGMARVIRALGTLAEADVVLNAGDSTVNGTAVEEYCVTAFARSVPDGATMVVADGNHDSAETSHQEGRAGMVVLDGSVTEVAGVRILGDSDPNATRIGGGTQPVGEESLTEAARRLADLACADGDVDLLLVHTPAVGNDAVARGCVPVQVSGHLHRRYGPLTVGPSVRYVSASTAGASLGAPTVGPLQGIAELTVLRLDPSTRRVLDHRLVRVLPTGGVSVGRAVPWPGTSSEAAATTPSTAPR